MDQNMLVTLAEAASRRHVPDRLEPASTWSKSPEIVVPGSEKLSCHRDEYRLRLVVRSFQPVLEQARGFKVSFQIKSELRSCHFSTKIRYHVSEDMIFPIAPTALALLVLSTPAAALPECSTDSALPCQCPSGTAYDQAVTIAVIGAAAKDVTALISDFFHPDWLGFVPFKTQGRDNKAGALRTSNVPTDYGSYPLEEILTKQHYTPPGGFLQRFEQLPSTVPVAYNSAHNGSFSGYWITIAADAIFGDETSVTWSVYACTTGHPINFKGFFEFALQNATDTLQTQGKVVGKNVKPFTIEEPGVAAS